jgi:P4 family phage/plasmid primase-like protien
MSTIEQFLKPYKLKKGSKNYTHLSLEPNGTYNIPSDKLNELYKIISIQKPSEPLHILESHQGQLAGPLIIDLDFKYPDEEKYHKRQYTEDNIKDFVELIHNSINFFFGDCGVEYVISEKPFPTIDEGKCVKDGIHLYAKGLILSYKDQHRFRNFALQKHILQNTFCLDYVINKPDDIYDASIIDTNSWYLLGCSKPDREPYLPTLSFISDEDELIMRKVEKASYAINDLSIRKSQPLVNVKMECIEEWEQYGDTKAKKKQTKKKIIDDTNESASQIKTEIKAFSCMTGGRPAFTETFDVLVKLVELWSRSREEKYESWRNCIFCIATCGKICGNVEGALQLAHSFSKGPRYDKEAVERTFKCENKGLLSFVVAHQWARQDNLVEYMNSGFSMWWKVPWAHFTVAREFYGLFPHSFLLIDGYWYVYNGVYWQKDSDSTKGDSKTIKKWISTKFYDILYEQIKLQRDAMEPNEYQKKLTNLNSLYIKSFKNDVLSELGQFYTHSDIEFDKRPELFAFNNKIYDLNQCKWIEPTADMYIATTTGYNYEEASKDDIESVEKWIGELFDSEEKTRYMLKFLASCMYRHNREEKGHFLLGRGRNGKGTLKEIMNSALGHYAGKIDMSYFTTPDKSCGSANPHLYNIRNARAIWLDEGETDGQIVGKFSTGKIKSFTGRDHSVVRQLFENKEVSFEMGHFIGLVNNMPTFTSIDFALLSRLVVIKFPYLFMPEGEYNPEDPSHRKRDPRIKEKVLEKRNAFIAMLIKWYSIYEEEGLTPPKCIKEETLGVVDELDEIGKWARNNLVFDKYARIPLEEVYNKYSNVAINYITIERFSKILNKQYEIKRARGIDASDKKISSRIIGYKIKDVIEENEC